ncbi:hypothetical protein MtrunA17_Chr2g0301781 [Medicago truncatula]|uniref:Uncharacterized protein n=1 Tax=Medicago truncatula TaxID=3880 RepID=A0A396JBE5_MEDTR|nr:hypothetical protein MtrunA17_Chr2g0301781 [Medicago truncatula]
MFGLEKAVDLNLNSLWIECDSVTVVKAFSYALLVPVAEPFMGVAHPEKFKNQRL